MAAMVAYPETQKKAQQELEKVVGRERLPSFGDYEKLPYIRAMVGSLSIPFPLRIGILCMQVKEIIRWGPAVPLGVPHRSVQV